MNNRQIEREAELNDRKSCPSSYCSCSPSSSPLRCRATRHSARVTSRDCDENTVSVTIQLIYVLVTPQSACSDSLFLAREWECEREQRAHVRVQQVAHTCTQHSSLLARFYDNEKTRSSLSLSPRMPPSPMNATRRPTVCTCHFIVFTLFKFSLTFWNRAFMSALVYSPCSFTFSPSDAATRATNASPSDTYAQHCFHSHSVA